VIENECYLCKCKQHTVRGVVRDNPSISVLECSSCGLVFLSNCSHITEDFYESSGMHASDDIELEQWRLETAADDERRVKFCLNILSDAGKSLLDVGCGNAGFLLKLKNQVGHVAGVEPEKRFYPCFSSEKIMVYPNIHDVPGKYELVTAFHVLEHVLDPIAFLHSVAETLTEHGQLIIETPNASDALLSFYQCEAFACFTYWSCHVMLYNQETLRKLVEQSGLQLKYIQQVQRYPLSNHLYWLGCGKPGGHNVWGRINSVNLNEEYAKQLAEMGCCDTLIACISK